MVALECWNAFESVYQKSYFRLWRLAACHCLLTAMYARQPPPLLQRSVPIHPTAAELIPTVFQDVRSIKT